MTKQARLALPLPTSLNALYINQWSGGRPTGKKILSAKGKQNREELMLNVERQMTKGDNLDWDVEYTKEGYIYMDIIAYVTRAGSDVDNFLKTLNDSIEETGLVYYNDSKIVPRFDRTYIDSKNPRILLTFTQTGWVGIFDNEEEYNSFNSVCKSCSRYRNGSCSILKKSLENKITEEVVMHDESKSPYCTKYKGKKS
ncbi:RusA family crossover junction endodeoxyribonuclease [Mammaliicoccus sp. P-M59]|uniref:RusA family crossover junction endodeoxyribonuclease n=1 Tax=Mammaliicoccus sp. P-M59 TaxID=2898718 RepID=UPI001EFB22AF|nr:RusA family crossover junction endodeoxyribonuclease [Mammaliicoccus sp. P-M59]